MKFLTASLNRSIRELKYHQSSLMRGWKQVLWGAVFKKPEIDLNFYEELKDVLNFHITGDNFSEKTINDLYILLSTYQDLQGISKSLNTIIKRAQEIADDLREHINRESKFKWLEASVNPLELREQNLVNQTRLLLRENMRIREESISAKANEKNVRVENGTLKLKLDALEQEARALRTESGRLNRLVRSFKELLNLAIRHKSPELVEKLNQLLLFKDDAHAFNEILKQIKDVLRTMNEETSVKFLLPEHNTTQQRRSERSLQEELRVLWRLIVERSKHHQKIFCVIMSHLSMLHDSPGQDLNLDLAHKFAHLIKNRYATLKHSLYQLDQSAKQRKPFFRISDAPAPVSSDLIELTANSDHHFVKVMNESPAKLDPNFEMVSLFDKYFAVFDLILSNNPETNFEQRSVSETLEPVILTVSEAFIPTALSHPMVEPKMNIAAPAA